MLFYPCLIFQLVLNDYKTRKIKRLRFLIYAWKFYEENKLYKFTLISKLFLIIMSTSQIMYIKNHFEGLF